MGEQEQTKRQDIVPFTFAKFIINEYIFFFASHDKIHSLSTSSPSAGVLLFAAVAILRCIYVEREDITKFWCFAFKDIAHNNSFSIISWPGAILSKHICILYTNLFSSSLCRQRRSGSEWKKRNGIHNWRHKTWIEQRERERGAQSEEKSFAGSSDNPASGYNSLRRCRRSIEVNEFAMKNLSNTIQFQYILAMRSLQAFCMLATAGAPVYYAIADWYLHTWNALQTQVVRASWIVRIISNRMVQNAWAFMRWRWGDGGTECVAQTENFFSIISIWCGSLFVVHRLHLRRSYSNVLRYKERAESDSTLNVNRIFCHCTLRVISPHAKRCEYEWIFRLHIHWCGFRYSARVAHMLATKNAIFMRSRSGLWMRTK